MKKNRLREVRLLKGMSQFDLALITKINSAEISKIENGKIFPYAGWKRRLSDALNVSINEIFPE